MGTEPKDYDELGDRLLGEVQARRRQQGLPPVEAYADEPRAMGQVQAHRVDEQRAASGEAPEIQLLGFTEEQVMAPIPPELFLLPSIPAEAYTLIAGALSSFKTTLLIYLLLWKATGFDLLDLDPNGAGCEVGPVVLVSYEDNDRRIFAKLQRVIQHGCRSIGETHGKAAASQFLARASKHVRRVTLAGNAAAGIVMRCAGLIAPNELFLDAFFRGVRKFAERDVMIGLDPLRLAIVGSQNDDDGADVAVHTLNRMAMTLPGSGLVVPSHTTKAGAQETADGYAGAAYATAGSALYSQHARSNFMMTRLKSPQIAEAFDRAHVTQKEIDRQSVVQLVHGRSSHGPESALRYLLMREGVLLPLTPRGARDAGSIADQGLPALAEALERLTLQNLGISKHALELDETLRNTLGGRKAVRDLIGLAESSSWLSFDGTTSDRRAGLTDQGRMRLATLAAQTRRESTENRQ